VKPQRTNDSVYERISATTPQSSVCQRYDAAIERITAKRNRNMIMPDFKTKIVEGSR